MNRRLTAAILCFAAASIAAADDELKSGLQVGDKAELAFVVKDVTGPKKGGELCYRCQFGTAAVINIQARQITDELAGLVKQLDQLVDDPADDAKRKKAFVVLLTDDPDDGQERLEKLAQRLALHNIPLTIFDGLRGPRGYDIARKAEVTVMMWNQSKIEHNWAFATGKLNAAAVKQIVATAREFLTQSVPAEDS
jgi:hypothetical protein